VTVLSPLPPKKLAIEVPLDPMVSCTVSMPSTPSSTSSTEVAAVDRVSRLDAGASVWVTVKVFWPLDPRKFVFMSGMTAPVPPSTSSAARIVTTGRRSVPRSTGT
jgi:hypothetical protein